MDPFVKRQNPAPTSAFLEEAVKAYEEYFVVFYEDGDSGDSGDSGTPVILVWMVVTDRFADCIAPWALKDDNVEVPIEKDFLFMKGRVNVDTLRKWLVHNPMMEPSQPEVMFDCDLTSDWQIVDHEGPLVPQEICDRALFASGLGYKAGEAGEFVPELKGFEDDCNVGVDLVYSINSTWKTVFENSNSNEAVGVN